LEIPIEIQASIFLKDFKKIVTQERGLDIVDRKENLKSLLQLGFTKKNCKHEILNLSVSDYCAGPKPDKDRPGVIWEFGKKISGYDVYIKLKIAEAGSARIAKCISFHIAEFPIINPLKKEKINKRGRGR
jgi:hypothetical protein